MFGSSLRRLIGARFALLPASHSAYAQVRAVMCASHQIAKSSGVPTPDG
tara:strand:+ start:226 stop:372 length:147 start_codon:yes stop_codon:yes gene_type:complete